jgi:hypothetical protein
VVAPDSALLAFDRADQKQVCVLTDQDSRVLARRTIRVKAGQLREAIEWGRRQVTSAGFIRARTCVTSPVGCVAGSYSCPLGGSSVDEEQGELSFAG